MPNKTKPKPKRVTITFSPTGIVQKRLPWLQRHSGGLDRTAIINSCIEAEFQRRKQALNELGRLAQGLRNTMPDRETLTFGPENPLPPLSYPGHPQTMSAIIEKDAADALQSDIRNIVLGAGQEAREYAQKTGGIVAERKEG